MGYLSVLVLESNLVQVHQRARLFFATWYATFLDAGAGLEASTMLTSPNVSCGKSLYANTTVANCPQCNHDVLLSINPSLVSFPLRNVKSDPPCNVPDGKSQMGTLTDETGAISSGKLIFSAQAWEQLLGRTAKELSESTRKHLKEVEGRLLFLRLTLLFGWSEKVGRLCVVRLWSH